ncbi:Putative regulatory protein fmdB [Methylophaga frappieri]|uniref:Putative regulatory protein fmdB n=1 Tax=Methylophaga frappieri (strain ATCC BAA-2434 / DSM 25690 / JAM7) TaxID=754477 RepID=I1YJD4_METFJ|nr:zinc ribbon domain-containing protein [Methylophaga frappieri]AFJ03027.1 Putative regulatory protein fmdB [Methylophaga frappieri]
MPIYDYRCATCGEFSALRKLAQANEDMICPECHGKASRIITAPYLALMDRPTRVAKERNEKSAHEPKTLRRSSCGCSGTHTCSANSAKSAGAKNGLQMQTKKTARPWMLGH